MNESEEVSFGSLPPGVGVAEAFGEEMLAWYNDKDPSPPVDRPSTLV